MLLFYITIPALSYNILLIDRGRTFIMGETEKVGANRKKVKTKSQRNN